MAVQKGAIRFTGKFANAVGYKSSAAAKAGQTFMREYVADVANPQTYAQAVQRAKLVPAAVFYQAFEKVLNHSFIPAGNRARNRAQFNKYALQLQAVPDVMKGQAFIPYLPYEISRGALGLSSLTTGSSRITSTSGGNAGVAFPNLKYGSATLAATAVRDLTLGAFSTAIIAANTGLSDGQELTFLAVLCDRADSTQRIAVTTSIVLNTADALTKLSDLINPAMSLAVADSHFEVLAADDTNWGVLTAGLIISAETESSWIYTNSRMTKSAWALDGFDIDEDAVIQSYMGSAASKSSTKILQQADNGVDQGVVPVSIANETYNVSTPVQGATYSAETAAVVTMTDGSKRVVTDSFGSLYNYANGEFTVITETVSGVAAELPISRTTWNGVRTILKDRVNF